MEVVIAGSADEVAELAAGIVARVVSTTERPVIGLATGSSPLDTYRSLIDQHRSTDLSFADATAVILDEYVGLPDDHPACYRSVIRSEFIDHVDLLVDRLYSPDVHAADLAAACDAYERTVIELGVDVQLLGIGSDGHIGFNEPGSSLSSRTRIKTLTDRTRTDNARYFDSIDDVPRHVVTQGLGTIGAAAHLVMIATGSAKAGPVSAMVEGPVSASCPASVLQFHRHVTVLLDDDAAGGLRNADYYREAYRHKPSWQHL